MFAFQIITFDNNYAIDPATVTVTRREGLLTLVATGLTWAGGQQKAAGRLVARLTRDADGAIDWRIEAEAGADIKAVKTIVRGLPLGRISVSAGQWRDLGGEEVFEYPALMGGMATPLVAIEGKDGRVWGCSAIQTEVRPARFALLPGSDGIKVEMLYEQAGWERRRQVETCGWRIAAARNFAGVAAPHFARVAATWRIPDFRSRRDVPEWAKHLSCVLSLHGEHWTGRVLNDFAQQLKILRWAARQIDPATVLVFLPGWDARYYWDYPNFRIGRRTGGEAGFARLIAEGHKLGFRFALMFGTNVANPAWPDFASIADAQVRDVYGQPYPANYVDWDGDRKGDGSMVFMNIGVASWRRHLTARIDDMLRRYGIDSYFLDIAGLWENNTAADMLPGLRALVDDLAERHPGVPAIAEMQFDAQMGFIGINHVARYALYPQANDGHVASFDHLSHPAPGLGSTGVHEAGFGRYRPVTATQRTIPTITFSADTFRDQRAAVMRDLATAKARFAARGGWT
jgi:hypothetical protein